MPSIKRMAARVSAAVMAAVTLTTTVAYADEPYTGYNYDWWGDPVPSQNGYVVDQIYTGNDMGAGPLTEPSDMFFSDNEDLFIADTSYKAEGATDSMKGRIVVTDSDFNLKFTVESLDFSAVQDWYDIKESELKSGAITQADYNKYTNPYFNGPTGVYVDTDEGVDTIYVADNANDRVVQFAIDEIGSDDHKLAVGKVQMVYTRPASNMYDASITFNPDKVLVDAAKNVYICIKSITKGAVVYSKEGDFNGYFGANRVEATGEVIMNAFWKLIFNREQAKRMRRSVPVEISNFDIDNDNFIYTVTESKTVTTDVLKKLNSAGTNIFTNLGYSDYTFGDYLTKYYRNKTYTSQITDVDVDENGVINLLDVATGRVFQYDDECQLLFIFGGLGQQKGTFTTPNAVESLGDKIYVLDGRKASVTVFKQTEFGAIVHNAIALFNKGKYEEAREPWEEAIRRDSNYWLAYIGLGNAYLNEGDYETAMKYFYYNSKTGYNDAFKSWRMNFIRDNFTLFAIIIVVLIIAIYVISSIRNKRRIKRRAEQERIFKERNKGKEDV
ncbi:MAG: tetratricopeptide repeat protein [Oscillospiraceae bacterium]|nr:tetratricopeptide repeat protein [Oscillospiraceae bacterium]